MFSKQQNHNTWFDHGGDYRDKKWPVLTMTLGMYGFCKYNVAKPDSFLHLRRFDFYFSPLVSHQWVFGAAYFVEYLIQESCPKSQASSCALQPPNPVVSIVECLHNLSFVLTDHLYMFIEHKLYMKCCNAWDTFLPLKEQLTI